MAIVFISPKKRQRTVLGIAIALFLVALAGVSFLAVLPEIKNQLTVIPEEGAFIMPDIKINFSVVDSDKVKNLQPFVGLQAEFNYIATDQAGKQQTGTILADSKTSAQKRLESTGLSAIHLQEVNVGRTDPFVSYIQAPVTTKPAIKK